jgi:hypothetical protein
MKSIVLAAALLSFIASAKAEDESLPHIVEKNGRFALFVDGAPYLMLGAQVNNSSAWPAVLPQVWPAIEMMHVNTVEMPIYWEQFEPEYGKFDYSVIDTLLDQARAENMHLVLLWFGTWKNGSNHYMPHWMKLDPHRYPNMIGADGKEIDSPSPVSKDTLAADIRAFSALMHHLKDADSQHTVLMVQVENEPGTWNGIRDYSPDAQKLFDGSAAPEVIAAMGKTGHGTWKQIFGDDADEYFHVWCISKFIGQVAAAGKAIYPIPLYVNASLRDPINPGKPPRYECGGVQDNVFPIWRAEAPAIDVLAPDIYQRDPERYLKVLDVYSRAGPLFVPETIGEANYSRFFFAALGHGAFGFSPFGMDFTRNFDLSADAPQTPEEFFAPTALNYQIIGPMAREIARLNFEGKLQAAVDPRTVIEAPPATEPIALRTLPPDAVLHFPHWDATVSFRRLRRGLAAATRPIVPPPPNGRVLVAELGENQFLVTGLYCRISFQPTGSNADVPWQYLSVEEGVYEDGVFKPRRILNGDQTDYGLIFSSKPEVLRFTLYLR